MDWRGPSPGAQDTCLLPGQPQLLPPPTTMETTIHLTGPSRGMVRIFIDRLGRAGAEGGGRPSLSSSSLTAPTLALPPASSFHFGLAHLLSVLGLEVHPGWAQASPQAKSVQGPPSPGLHGPGDPQDGRVQGWRPHCTAAVTQGLPRGPRHQGRPSTSQEAISPRSWAGPLTTPLECEAASQPCPGAVEAFG